MNEIKLSTKVDKSVNRLAIKMNTEDLGVKWNKGDIIRVMTYKDNNTIVLKKVGKKALKTIAHTLTVTGSGKFNHNLGLYVKHKSQRFKKDFKKVDSINAACRFLDKAKTQLEIYMPNEMFV